jgi:hypothetical protein
VSNLSRLRRSVRNAQLPESDGAGVEFAALLARLLDKTTPRTLTQIAAGERSMHDAEVLEVIRIVGPQYLRTLTALGLTRAGRGAIPASQIPTVGSPAGASADSAAHDAHRARFSERRSG